MPNFIKVGNVSDLKPGENKVVDVNGTEVALFNVDGEFFAIHLPSQGRTFRRRLS